MRNLTLIFLCGLLCFGPNARAASSPEECTSNPIVPVNIIPRFDAPAYDLSQGLGSIQGLASDARYSIHESLTLGVTRYAPFLEVNAPVRGIQLPNGLICAHVDHLDVTVGYRDVTVLIANEIPQGSCGFNEVMAHEQKHIAVNQAVLAEYTPRIEAELRNYIQMNGLIRDQREDYGMAVLHEKLQSIIDSLIEEMSLENQRRQQLVDSDEEYRRVTNSCGGELAKISSHYLYHH